MKQAAENTTGSAELPVVETKYRVYDPSILPYPYPRYRLIRENEPVFRSPRGFWRISRFTEAQFVMRDSRFGHGDGTVQANLLGAPADLEGFEGNAGKAFTFLDPPDHTRLRALVSKAFTRRTVQDMEPRIAEITRELADELADGPSTADLVSSYAFPLPVKVISELLGIPEADRDQFKVWTAQVARSLDTDMWLSEQEIADRETMRREFLAYARGLVEFRQRNPGDDLVSQLVAAEQSGDRLSMPELLVTIITLISSGYETTVSAVGNGILALLRNPEQLDHFRAHPERAADFVEELVRYDPPVHYTARVALADVEVGGHLIRSGDLLIVMLGSANRDSALVEDPDQLNLGREHIRSLAFGVGMHFCFGAPLARTEIRLALTTLFQRFPNIRLATEAELEYRKNFVVRSLTGLPVVLRD